ncbi:MAG: hypothetical protein WKF75_19045 [Singulisphaera sp.]
MGCYFAVAAGLAAWWFVGQVVLWRVTRAARPVPGRSATSSSASRGPGVSGSSSSKATGSPCRSPTPGSVR